LQLPLVEFVSCCLLLGIFQHNSLTGKANDEGRGADKGKGEPLLELPPLIAFHYQSEKISQDL
jgi:hypothetical protein